MLHLKLILKPNLIIRADGGPSIGMGHVIRCIALAEMLKNSFEISFAIQSPAGSIINAIRNCTEKIIALPQTDDYESDAAHFLNHIQPADVVVLDGYHFKTDYQKAIKASGAKLVVIDDMHDWHHVADAIINHAEGIVPTDYRAEDYTQFYLGLDYVLLRKKILENTEPIKNITSIKKAFISMGAADENNLTQKFTEALIAMSAIEEIHLMLGAVNPHLKKIEQLIENNKQVNIVPHFNISAEALAVLLKKCDVSICPASSISLESCAVGIGLISGYTAENQAGILNGLIKHKMAISFGDFNMLTEAELKTKLEAIAKAPEQLDELIANQKKMIDGRSPERLQIVFNELAASTLHFRFATEEDTDLYYKWANDPSVRANSFSQEKVIYEDHVRWFRLKLTSENCFFYLFSNDRDEPVGQVRIDKSGAEIVIGISIDEAFRGKSLAVEMLKKATGNYLQKFPEASITAYIKVENTSSLNSFRKAGFTNEENVEVQGCKSYKLYKTRSKI
ncbi:MAG: UDP-2,4-diacetamido-2,4, 6-trideoxy-beta-L-altropyranose hydrolase [Bacteroidetes bacterium]|nr:UDP-2,4-diacetamido-2,4, 6-trideoxy-beta-L-altropyranose hydrolase [Bacteroidota bacterium]